MASPCTWGISVPTGVSVSTSMVMRLSAQPERQHQLHVIDHEEIELMQVQTQRAGDNMNRGYYCRLAGPGMMAT